jgi:hypothetical protein
MNILLIINCSLIRCFLEKTNAETQHNPIPFPVIPGDDFQTNWLSKYQLKEGPLNALSHLSCELTTVLYSKFTLIFYLRKEFALTKL